MVFRQKLYLAPPWIVIHLREDKRENISLCFMNTSSFYRTEIGSSPSSFKATINASMTRRHVGLLTFPELRLPTVAPPYPHPLSWQESLCRLTDHPRRH